MKKIFLGLALVATAYAFTSCTEETYDIVGNPNNLIFIRDGASMPSYTVHQTPVGVFGSFVAEATVRCTKTTGASVSAAVHPELVAEYNELNGTDYEPMPANACKLTTPRVTINAGEQKATETLKLEANPEGLAQLDASKKYLIALQLSEPEGGAVSEDFGTTYYEITIDSKANKDLRAISDVVGSRLTDYSGWTVTCGGQEQDATLIFGGDEKDESIVPYGGKTCVLDQYTGYISLASSNTVVIDMKKDYKVSAVAACNYFKLFSNRAVRKYFTNYTFEVSRDGNEWINLGNETFYPDSSEASEDGFQYISLYDGYSCRYIRLTFNVDPANVKNYNYLSAVRVFTTE